MRKQIDGQISLFDYYIAAGEADRQSESEQFAQSNRQEQQKTMSVESPLRLYRQCAVCWCSDCKHNEKLDAVPRDFAGVKKACPSCAFCLEKNRAEICEINSYDNGCKLRAVEEGIAP